MKMLEFVKNKQLLTEWFLLINDNIVFFVSNTICLLRITLRNLFHIELDAVNTFSNFDHTWMCWR